MPWLSHGGPELLLLFVIFILTPIISPWLPKGHKLKAAVILWVITALLAYWDVALYSVKAWRLCKAEAGLHVYKTVKAEGLLGLYEIKYWSKYGFNYLEAPNDKKKFRYTMQDGLVKEEEVPEFISHYEYTAESKLLEMPFERSKEFIRDRQTGEILGDIVTFAVTPAWVDRLVLGFLGFSWSRARCDGDYIPALGGYRMFGTGDLIKAVFKPESQSQGE